MSSHNYATSTAKRTKGGKIHPRSKTITYYKLERFFFWIDWKESCQVSATQPREQLNGSAFTSAPFLPTSPDNWPTWNTSYKQELSFASPVGDATTAEPQEGLLRNKCLLPRSQMFGFLYFKFGKRFFFFFLRKKYCFHKVQRDYDILGVYTKNSRNFMAEMQYWWKLRNRYWKEQQVLHSPIQFLSTKLRKKFITNSVWIYLMISRL